MSKDFFPPRPKARPTIYAYEDTNPQYAGLLKVGYTTVDVQSRVAQQYPTLRPGKPPYRIVLEESAMRNDGTVFTDHDVHRMLRLNGVKNPDGEWFRCTVAQVKAAIIAVRTGQLNEENRSLDFKMRPEQEAAVEKTAAYFASWRKEKGNRNKPPHFLWNAKMRFGKTFAAYQLAKKMGWRKVLVLTFKPAVQSAWEEDLKMSRGFQGLAVHLTRRLVLRGGRQEEAVRLFWLVSRLPGPKPKHRRHQDEKRMGALDQLGLRDSGRIPLRRMAGEREGTV